MKTKETKALQKAIDIIGTQRGLAELVEAKQGHVWNWLHRDKRVPPNKAIPIEVATDGAVTRHDLRPDVFGEA